MYSMGPLVVKGRVQAEEQEGVLAQVLTARRSYDGLFVRIGQVCGCALTPGMGFKQ